MIFKYLKIDQKTIARIADIDYSTSALARERKALADNVQYMDSMDVIELDKELLLQDTQNYFAKGISKATGGTEYITAVQVVGDKVKAKAPINAVHDVQAWRNKVASLQRDIASLRANNIDIEKRVKAEYKAIITNRVKMEMIACNSNDLVLTALENIVTFLG